MAVLVGVAVAVLSPSWIVFDVPSWIVPVRRLARGGTGWRGCGGALAELNGVGGAVLDRAARGCARRRGGGGALADLDRVGGAVGHAADAVLEHDPAPHSAGHRRVGSAEHAGALARRPRRERSGGLAARADRAADDTLADLRVDEGAARAAHQHSLVAHARSQPFARPPVAQVDERAVTAEDHADVGPALPPDLPDVGPRRLARARVERVRQRAHERGVRAARGLWGRAVLAASRQAERGHQSQRSRAHEGNSLPPPRGAQATTSRPTAARGTPRPAGPPARPPRAGAGGARAPRRARRAARPRGPRAARGTGAPSRCPAPRPR